MKVKQINYLWYLSIAIILINIILFLIKPGGEKMMAVISDALPVICSFIASWCLFKTSKAFAEKDCTKTAWMLIFLGVLIDFIAELLYGGQEIVLGVDMSELNKSVADIFWIISYCFTISGLIILLKGYFNSGFPRGKMIPYVIFIVVLMTIIIAIIQLLLKPIYTDTETNIIDKAILLIYPIFDTVIICLSLLLLYVTSMFKKGLISAPWRIMAIAFVFMGAADILYSYYSWQGTYDGGSMIDVGWNAGYLLLALTGLYQTKLITSVKGGN